MKNLLFASLLLSAAVVSCSDNAEPAPKKESKPKTFETFEEMVRHEVETRLEIPRTEKYNLKIYREQIDADGIEDAVITVNRPAFAQSEAVRVNNVKRMAESDFSGYFNYFIYYDGATREFAKTIYRIGSSPARELDVEFISITSPGQKDISISYRIVNSGFKKFYTIKPDHQPELMFEWDWFSKAGEAENKAVLYELKHDVSPVSKDFFLYESSIDNSKDAEKGIYRFEPEITKKGKLIYHFFYDPNYYKYRGIPND